MPISKTVAIIPVPFDLGASRRGAAAGPQAILQAGLEAKLNGLLLPYLIGEDVLVPGQVPAAQTDARADTVIGNYGEASHAELVRPMERPAMKYPSQNAAVNSLLATRVSEALSAGHWPLVLGGDHSIAIGTIAGLSMHHQRLGVLWIDAHSDLNTDLTTPSGNIHGMSLAASLGLGDPLLTKLGGHLPKIYPEHVAIVGARSLDPEEKKLIRALGISCYTMHDIDRRGIDAIMEEALQKVSTGTDGVHLSFDIDSVDPLEAPATGTPVRGGLSSREAFLALELAAESDFITSAEFVELNPLQAAGGPTASLIVDFIGSLLGERIL